MIRCISLIILCFIIATSSVWGATYYVDFNAAGGGDGSFATPWNSMSQVASHSFSNSDDLYFRAGTSTNITGSLSINWSGTANDRVVIGAYHIVGGQPVIGIGGNAMPIFDGQGLYPASDNLAVFDAWNNLGHVTIQDLHIRNTYGLGIRIGYAYTSAGTYSTNFIVRNCRLITIGRSAIMSARASYGLIEGNYINGSNGRCVVNYAGNCVNDGAAIEVTGMGSELLSRHNVIRGNEITGSYETIGIYKGSRYSIVEDNILYRFGRVGVYMANSRNSIVRNNLIYEPDNSIRGRQTLIHADSETHLQADMLWIGGHEIYGNYLAGGFIGIRLGCQSADWGVYNSGNKIYNNRLVDNDFNFRFYVNVPGWENNEIYNNYSFILTSGLVHTSHMSPYGITWNGNHYNTSIVGVTGNAATGAIFNQVVLQKTTGWRSLVPGQVTREDFALSGESAQTCADNHTLCLSGTTCLAAWPDYFWCPNENGCQSVACEEEPPPVDPPPPGEVTPFVGPIAKPDSLYLPMILDSAYPKVITAPNLPVYQPVGESE